MIGLQFRTDDWRHFLFFWRSRWLGNQYWSHEEFPFMFFLWFEV